MCVNEPWPFHVRYGTNASNIVLRKQQEFTPCDMASMIRVLSKRLGSCHVAIWPRLSYSSCAGEGEVAVICSASGARGGCLRCQLWGVGLSCCHSFQYCSSNADISSAITTRYLEWSASHPQIHGYHDRLLRFSTKWLCQNLTPTTHRKPRWQRQPSTVPSRVHEEE